MAAPIEVPLADISGKAKLGQNRTPAQLARLMEHLWRRGDPGDPRAIELVRAHNPEVPAPGFLAAPSGVTLHCLPAPELAVQAGALLATEYWNTEMSPAEIAAAHLGSPAWVAAVDADGALVGTARAITDRSKRAWVYDVCVATALRGRGLGKRLIDLLLDHPAVRGVRTVWLATRDAQGLYAGFGFIESAAVPPPAYSRIEMVLRR